MATEKTKEQLEQELALMQAQMLKQQEDAEAVHKELLEKLEEKNLQKKGGLKVVSMGSERYQVTAPKFKIGPNDYTEDDIESNGELLEQLIKFKAGVIELIVTEEPKETKDKKKP